MGRRCGLLCFELEVGRDFFLSFDLMAHEPSFTFSIRALLLLLLLLLLPLPLRLLSYIA